jgi:hypothetical protein
MGGEKNIKKIFFEVFEEAENKEKTFGDSTIVDLKNSFGLSVFCTKYEIISFLLLFLLDT